MIYGLLPFRATNLRKSFARSRTRTQKLRNLPVNLLMFFADPQRRSLPETA